MTHSTSTRQVLRPPVGNIISKPRQEKAAQILDVIIRQTSQVEYDPLTVEKLIKEYETLTS